MNFCNWQLYNTVLVCIVASGVLAWDWGGSSVHPQISA